MFDPTKPENDMLLINFPAACRANWIALEAMTEASLLITNAKCAPAMNLADTKLAQITTASKVHGTAITGLASVPAGAGVLPSANSPNKLSADSLDSTPQYLDGLIDTDDFDISAGDLLQIKPAKDPFQTGDWISSSVTTARTGWSNVSATYANKFMRINATPLTTGGSDTHGHADTLAAPAHTHAGASHTHDQNYEATSYKISTSDGTASRVMAASNSGSVFSTSVHETGTDADFMESGVQATTPGAGGPASATALTGSVTDGANVPAYVQVTIFQKS